MKNVLVLFFCMAAMGMATVPEVGVVSQWLQTPPGKRDFEITQERSRPVLMGDIIYASNLSGEVYAIHRLGGYRLWERKFETGIEGALTYGRSKVIVGDLYGNLIALNARDGSDSWRFKISAEWLSPPAISKDRVYAATSNDELYALSETQGKELWHYSHRGDEKMTVRGSGGPVVYGNEIFQGFSNGDLVALSATDGKVLWAKKLRSKERFYDVDMSPFVDEKSVIVGTFDGKVYDLDRTTGNVNWIFPVGSYGGFLVEENRLYFSGLDGNFYCLDRLHGQLIWKTSFKHGVGLTPAKAGDYLVISTSGDPVYVLNPRDGQILWTGSLGTGTLTSAVGTTDGWFYVLSNYGNLYSFELLKNVKQLKAPETVLTPSAVLRDFGKPNRNRYDS